MQKRALITGASEGIGYCLSQALAKEGYLITGVARSEDKLKGLVKELGVGHEYLVADLTQRTGQTAVVQRLGAQPFDLLVNNAGIGIAGAFTNNPIEKQMAMLELNCSALVRLSHAFLANAKKGDALINVSSALAFMPAPGMGLYSATKSFVTAFTETLWFEQKKRGVYVMALHPGITTTRFQTNAGGKVEDLPENLSQTPEEVARFAVAQLRARKKPSVVSGPKNLFFSTFVRLLPRKSAVSMMGSQMRE